MFGYVHWSIPAALAAWLILLTAYAVHTSKHRLALRTKLCDTLETWKRLEKIAHDLSISADDDVDGRMQFTTSHVYSKCISDVQRIMRCTQFGERENTENTVKSDLL